MLGKKEGVDVSEELKAYNDIVFVNVVAELSSIFYNH